MKEITSSSSSWNDSWSEELHQEPQQTEHLRKQEVYLRKSLEGDKRFRVKRMAISGNRKTDTQDTTVLQHSRKNPFTSAAGLERSLGAGKSYPLQYSGLQTSMDCIVHGVTQSWTWLSDFHWDLLWQTPCEVESGRLVLWALQVMLMSTKVREPLA